MSATTTGHAGLDASWAEIGCPDLEKEWRERLRAVPGATVFSGPAFQRAIRAAFPAKDAAEAIVLRRQGRMIGLLPVAALPLRQGPFLLRESGFARNAHTLRNHLLMEPDPACAESLLAAWRARREWDTLLLENLPDLDGLPAMLTTVARDLGLRADDPAPARDILFADLPDSHEEFLATRSGQMRRQLRAKRRALEAAGRLGVEALTGPALSGALGEWRSVVAASWQASYPAAASGKADWTLHAALAENGRLWLLRLDGQPIAALRMLEDARADYVHTMHFDQAFADLAPGVVLFEAMMRDACARGVHRVDFNGSNAFFARWATGTTRHVSVRIYRPGLRGLLAQGGRRTKLRLRRRITEG